jgi:hypothetical protein
MPGARLSQDERAEIALGLAVQSRFADIARGPERLTSTVTREVGRNGWSPPLSDDTGAARDQPAGSASQAPPARGRPRACSRGDSAVEVEALAPVDREPAAPRASR